MTTSLRHSTLLLRSTVSSFRSSPPSQTSKSPSCCCCTVRPPWPCTRVCRVCCGSRRRRAGVLPPCSCRTLRLQYYRPLQPSVRNLLSAMGAWGSAASRPGSSSMRVLLLQRRSTLPPTPMSRVEVSASPSAAGGCTRNRCCKGGAGKPCSARFSAAACKARRLRSGQAGAPRQARSAAPKSASRRATADRNPHELIASESSFGQVWPCCRFLLALVTHCANQGYTHIVQAKQISSRRTVHGMRCIPKGFFVGKSVRMC